MGLLKDYRALRKNPDTGYQFWYAERWTGALTIIFGLLAYFVMGWEDPMHWIPAAIFAAVFLIFFLYGLIAVPYELLKKERAAKRDLEAKYETPIVLEFENSSPFVYEETGQPGVWKRYRFRVTNNGPTLLSGCKAQMVSAIDDHGLNHIGIPFSLARSGTGTEIFPLRSGEEKFIDLFANLLRDDLKKQPLIVMSADQGKIDMARRLIQYTGLPRINFTITVQVLSDAPAAQMKLRFERDGDEWKLERLDDG